MHYNTLIVHFNYYLLVWGSYIKAIKFIYFCKQGLRLITNNDYLAHIEPICRYIHPVKVTDMYCMSVWKIYFKLMNNPAITERSITFSDSSFMFVS